LPPTALSKRAVSGQGHNRRLTAEQYGGQYEPDKARKVTLEKVQILHASRWFRSQRIFGPAIQQCISDKYLSGRRKSTTHLYASQLHPNDERNGEDEENTAAETEVTIHLAPGAAAVPTQAAAEFGKQLRQNIFISTSLSRHCTQPHWFAIVAACRQKATQKRDPLFRSNKTQTTLPH